MSLVILMLLCLEHQQGMANPIFPPEKHLQAPPASVMNDQTKKADSSTRQLHTKVEEFPERPGQSECQYFMKFGYCKFKSACRYHHPKNRVSKPTACVLSPMGLPLRPVSKFFYFSFSLVTRPIVIFHVSTPDVTCPRFLQNPWFTRFEWVFRNSCLTLTMELSLRLWISVANIFVHSFNFL